jgi:Planctomycete cytochrome C
MSLVASSARFRKQALHCLCVLALSPAVLLAGSEKVDFNRDIRPILSDNCYACHGPDSNKRKAGLRFDIKEAAVRYAV